MKIMLDVKCDKTLKQNDIIRYNTDSGCFEVVSYECFNNELYKKINDLNKEIEDLKSRIDNLKENVNEKLKNYHNILNVLVKEN